MNVERVSGNGGRLAIKARLFKPTVYLVCAAFLLASCSTYKAMLTQQSPQRAGAVVLPSPTEDWKLIEGGEKITGWVKLRFEVSATGEVRGVQTIETSDARLSATAARMMAAWPFEPGTIDGEAKAFQDIEFKMTFFEESRETSDAVGIIVLGIIIVGIAVAAAAVSLDRNSCSGNLCP